MAKGTFSTGWVYDLFESETVARILFVTHASVICRLISLNEVEKETDGENTQTVVASGVITESRAQFGKAKIQIEFHG